MVKTDYRVKPFLSFEDKKLNLAIVSKKIE
jgi:hypothetical protein